MSIYVIISFVGIKTKLQSYVLAFSKLPFHLPPRTTTMMSRAVLGCDCDETDRGRLPVYHNDQSNNIDGYRDGFSPDLRFESLSSILRWKRKRSATSLHLIIDIWPSPGRHADPPV